jgi:hypothetical protein
MAKNLSLLVTQNGLKSPQQSNFSLPTKGQNEPQSDHSDPKRFFQTPTDTRGLTPLEQTMCPANQLA